MVNSREHILTFDDSPIGRNYKIDSESYNEIINSLKRSVLRSVNRARSINNKLTKFNEALVSENQMLAAKLAEITTMTSKVDRQNNTALVTGYDTPVYDSSSTTTQNVNIDALTGQVTCGYAKKWSKVVRYTNVDGLKKASLDTTIILDSTQMAHSDDIYNMLDGKQDSFWLLDTTPNALHTVVINFPTSIKPFVNSMVLTPFPAFNMDLEKIYVQATDGTLLDVTPDGYQASTLSGLNAHFGSLSWGNSITLNLRARADRIGISNLDLFLIDYFDEYATVKYSVPSLTGVAINSIEQIDLMDFGLHEVIDSDMDYNVYDNVTVTANNGVADTVISKDTLLGNDITPFVKAAGTAMTIAFKFKKFNGQTPIFRSAKITYRS